MAFMQCRTGFENSYWEQENSYSEEYKHAGYATSGHPMAHYGQPINKIGAGGWANKVTESHGYNSAGGGRGYLHNQMPGQYLATGYNANCENFSTAQYGGHKMMLNPHPPKRRTARFSASHEYYKCSESDSDSD